MPQNLWKHQQNHHQITHKVTVQGLAGLEKTDGVD